MYRLLDLDPGRERDWQDFAERHGSVFHSLAWKRVLEDSFGYGSRYLLLLDDAGSVAGVLPVMVARDLRLARVAVSLPFVNHLDLCCHDDAARAALVDSLPGLPQRLGVRSLELRLLHDEPAAEPAVLDRSNATFVLDLSRAEDALLAGCSASHRNHVRKVYRRETFVADADASDLDAFYAIYARRQKQLGSPAPAIGFFRRLRDALPGNVVVLLVRERASGAPAAAMFLVASGDTLYYLWGGADVAYHREHVNPFLYWEALRLGIARGFRRLDLGRSSAAEGHTGTFAFKAQFGAAPTPLSYRRFGGASAALAEQRARLAGAVAVWKKLPAAVTDPLGALLIRYVLP